MVVDFDIDGDGKITEEEVAMKERMLENRATRRKGRITEVYGLGSYGYDDYLHYLSFLHL